MDEPDLVVVAAGARVVDEGVFVLFHGDDGAVALGEELAFDHARAVEGPVAAGHEGFGFTIENEFLGAAALLLIRFAPTDLQRHWFAGQRGVVIGGEGIRVRAARAEEKEGEVDVVRLGVGWSSCPRPC